MSRGGKINPKSIMEKVRETWNRADKSSYEAVPKSLSELSQHLPRMQKIEAVKKEAINSEAKAKSKSKISEIEELTRSAKSDEEKLAKLRPVGLNKERAREFEIKSASFFKEMDAAPENSGIKVESKKFGLKSKSDNPHQDFSFLEPDPSSNLDIEAIKKMTEADYDSIIPDKTTLEDVNESDDEIWSKPNPFGYISDPEEKIAIEKRAAKELENKALENLINSVGPSHVLTSYALSYRNQAMANEFAKKEVSNSKRIEKDTASSTPIDPSKYLTTPDTRGVKPHFTYVKEIQIINLKRIPELKFKNLKKISRTRVILPCSASIKEKPKLSPSSPSSPYFLINHPHAISSLSFIPTHLIGGIRTCKEIYIRNMIYLNKIREASIRDLNMFREIKWLMFRLAARNIMKTILIRHNLMLKSLQYWFSKYPNSDLDDLTSPLEIVETAYSEGTVSSSKAAVLIFEEFCEIIFRKNPFLSAPSVHEKALAKFFEIKMSGNEYDRDMRAKILESLFEWNPWKLKLVRNSSKMYRLPTRYMSARDRHSWAMYGSHLVNVPALLRKLENVVVLECYNRWVKDGKSVSMHSTSPLHIVCYLPRSIQSDSPYSNDYMVILNTLEVRLKSYDWSPLPAYLEAKVDVMWKEMIRAARPFVEIKLENGKLATREELWEKYRKDMKRITDERRENIITRDNLTDRLKDKYEGILGSFDSKALKNKPKPL